MLYWAKGKGAGKRPKNALLYERYINRSSEEPTSIKLNVFSPRKSMSPSSFKDYKGKICLMIITVHKGG